MTEPFCKCVFDSVQSEAKNYHWGLEVCSLCDSPYRPDMLERIGKYEDDKRSSPEAVDHPSHYQSDKFEVIDIIEAFNLGFNLGNAVKYILRAGKKDNFTQDLEKAMWYLNREINK